MLILQALDRHVHSLIGSFGKLHFRSCHCYHLTYYVMVYKSVKFLGIRLIYDFELSQDGLGRGKFHLTYSNDQSVFISGLRLQAFAWKA